MLVVDDVGAAVAAAEAAVASATDPGTLAYVLARTALGQALYLAGRPAESQAALEAALRAPLAPQQFTGVSRASAVLALVSLGLGEEARAGELVRRAVQLAAEWEQTGNPDQWLNNVALGQVLVREGRLEEAATVLAQGIEPMVEALVAWPLLQVLALLPFVALHQAQGQPAAAYARLEEAWAAARRCRDAGMLPGQLAELERSLGRQPLQPAGLREALTGGEFRILRMLASERTPREIGRELYVSVHTVKAHTRSIYSKLDVTSRRAAVARARALNLLA
jgi:LuxR family maltose regulon positive regulatory protein